jgi:protein TonB
MSIAVAAAYPSRRYVLPWTPRVEERRRFRRITRSALAAALLFAVIVSLVPLPDLEVAAVKEMPERLVKLVQEQKIPPPPPPVPEVQPVEPVEEVVAAAPEPVAPEPVEPRRRSPDRVVPRAAPTEPTARERASRAGLLPLQDRLAALRDNTALTKAAQTRNLTGKVGETTRAERSLVTSNVASGSGGIDTASLSRGYGAGGGALEGHDTTAVSGSFGAAGGTPGGKAASAARTGGSASRSREEIELVFDRNKSAIYALYSRALRSNPQLQGKLVLELTIAPDGRVTDCRVVSSELGDEELERKLVARVKMFRFEDKDVATVTTTKPIDFFPA